MSQGAFESVIPYQATLSGPATTFTPGSPVEVSFNDLPTEMDGAVCHLAGLLFDIEFSPTFTTAPTIHGVNGVFNDIKITDGLNLRCDVNGFNGLRSHEIFENGDVLVPDPDTNNASTNRYRVVRPWLVGPGGFDQSDYLLPIAGIQNGAARLTWGSLANISADTTAVTVNRFTVTALIALREGEIKIPPLFERKTQLLTASNQSIQGEGRYTHLGLCKTNYAAFAAGELGNVTIDSGRGLKNAQPLPMASLDAVAQMLYRVGPFTKIRSEFSAATVDNEKTVNLGTPTALTATDATHAALYVNPRGANITRLPVQGRNIRPVWTGTQTSVNAFYGRILSQGAAAYGKMVSAACEVLKKDYNPGNIKVATRSKVAFRGTNSDGSMMPLKYKL